MHLRVSGKTMLLKWAIPVILVVAMLGFFGLRAWGGSSGGGLGDMEITDYNPGYSSELVVPSEGAQGPGGVFVLYSIDVAEPTSMIPLDSTTAGALLSVTVTNNIGEAIANDGSTVCNNGDIMGNIVVVAEVYHASLSSAGVLAYPQTPCHSVGIAEFDNIIVHPGKSVVVQVPEAAISVLPPEAGPYAGMPTGMGIGDIVLYKAEYVGADACFTDPGTVFTGTVSCSTP